MEAPRICQYCEQAFQDGDVVHVSFRQRRGRVPDVLHAVIDDLVVIDDRVDGALN